MAMSYEGTHTAWETVFAERVAFSFANEMMLEAGCGKQYTDKFLKTQQFKINCILAGWQGRKRKPTKMKH